MQNFEFASMVIFRRKNICGISTENYVLCSFKLKKDPIFRICAIRMDLREKYGLCPISIKKKKLSSNKCQWTAKCNFECNLFLSIKKLCIFFFCLNISWVSRKKSLVKNSKTQLQCQEQGENNSITKNDDGS